MEEFVPGVEKPEELYRELDQLGRELGIPVPQMYLGIRVEDKDGNVTYESHGRSHTHVRNFWNQYLMARMWGSNSIDGNVQISTYAAGGYAIKGFLGIVRDAVAVAGSPPILWGLSNTTVTSSNAAGIIFGTSNTAESFEAYAMGALCVHGTGTNQLTYMNNGTPAKAYNAQSKTWTTTFTRSASNSSSASIGINEVGWAGYCTYFGGTTYYMLLSRDVLGATVTLNPGDLITGTYTTTLGFPT